MNPGKTLVPAPTNTPISLVDLYRRYTHDPTATHLQIAKALVKQSHDRQQAISLVLKGYSTHQIAGALERSQGAALSLITHALKAAWKTIHELPKWHRTGYRGTGTQGKGRIRPLRPEK